MSCKTVALFWRY